MADEKADISTPGASAPCPACSNTFAELQTRVKALEEQLQQLLKQQHSSPPAGANSKADTGDCKDLAEPACWSTLAPCLHTRGIPHQCTATAALRITEPASLRVSACATGPSELVPAPLPESVTMGATRVVMHQIVAPSEVDALGICFGGQVCMCVCANNCGACVLCSA